MISRKFTTMDRTHTGITGIHMLIHMVTIPTPITVITVLRICLDSAVDIMSMDTATMRHVDINMVDHLGMDRLDMGPSDMGEAATWEAATWEAVTWEAVTWEAVTWGAATWEAATWEAATWGAATWEAGTREAGTDRVALESGGYFPPDFARNHRCKQGNAYVTPALAAASLALVPLKGTSTG
jgi:hypothetical protein